MNRKIEDVINEVLKGDSRKNALEFVEHLQANCVQFPESDNYFWDVDYEDKRLFTINIEINVNNETASFDTFVYFLPSAWENDCASVSEHTKEILWDNIRPCEIIGCGKCSPGINKTLFGKQFNNLCKNFLGIYSPDAKTVTFMKEIFDGIKSDVLEGNKST